MDLHALAPPLAGRPPLNLQIWDHLSASEFESLSLEYGAMVFAEPEDTRLVAAWQGFPIGFLVARGPTLKRLWVQPDMRRKRVGTTLVQRLSELRNSELLDPEAAPFFASLGWTYQEPDTLAFRRKLDLIPGFEVPPQYSLRPFQYGNQKPWIELIRACFGDQAPQDDNYLLRHHVKSTLFEPGDILLAWRMDRLVGTLVSRTTILDDQLSATIDWLAVHPDCRREGLGQLLLLSALHLLRAKRFEVVHLNSKPTFQAALQLYHKLGFEQYQPHVIFRAP